MLWTTIGCPPPMVTDPTLTGRVAFRGGLVKEPESGMVCVSVGQAFQSVGQAFQPDMARRPLAVGLESPTYVIVTVARGFFKVKKGVPQPIETGESTPILPTKGESRCAPPDLGE
jgi:hypothetical protein